VLDPFQLPYVQEGAAAILILSIAAGLVGSWIVLRGLAFYSHAVGTAAFPGLVLADGLGFAAALGAFGAAAAFAVMAAAIGRSRRTSSDSVTALLLAGFLAAGVILASDVFGSGSNIETLLFGSLLLIDGGDILLAALASGLALLATLLLGGRWLAAGFDPEAARALRSSSRWLDLALLGLIALAATAALAAVGALLVTALLVVPAATARLVTRSVRGLMITSALLAAAEGIFGIWLSVQTDAPPGATIAVLSGAGFAAAFAWRHLRVRRAGLAAATVAALALVAFGCGGSDDGGGSGVRVVATTTEVADLVGQVGGAAVEIDRILDPNTDPHEYEARPSDVEAVADATIVFRSGGDLDDWSEELISDSGSDAELVDLSQGLRVQLTGEAEEGGGEELDPHWWHDPRNVEAAVGEITAALIDAEPEQRATISANAERYVAQVRALDAGIRRCIGTVPPSDRKLVTDHDAFRYFANRYGLEVIGAVIPAITTQAQASAGELSDLERVIREQDVKAVFPEASVSGKLAEVIARDTGASADNELYGDTLGPEDSSGATYLAMEEANADAIVRGLTGGRRGCEIPAEAG
jgi:ABC-type Zn uptake system ZnuABC Zn-binding protein ZnuA/ABC-type Mn2+/Zn2+ transport system permease subunit